jgi:DEP domain-containing protein 5
MLVAGYEGQFNDSIRYWRTRFVVIPTQTPPSITVDEKLNEEEIRILGIDKLAEIFTRLRWQPPDEKSITPQPLRFLPTTLSPAMSILDDTLMDKLDQIHAAGPLRKNIRSQRDIAELTLAGIAKAMRDEDGVPFKLNHWHKAHYHDSFTGSEFVSWLVREFRDVSSRGEGVAWGVKLLEQGLIEHCRGHHGFLDGFVFLLSAKKIFIDCS